MFCYSEPVKRVQDGSDVIGFGSFHNSTSKRVLDLLEASYLRLGEVVIENYSSQCVDNNKC